MIKSTCSVHFWLFRITGCRRRENRLLISPSAPKGSPEAVKAWFYPGDNYGHEFVYPKAEATKLAKANNEPVASMTDQEFNGPSMKTGHVKAVKPTGEEVDVIQVFGSSPQTTSSTGHRQSSPIAGNRANNR